MIKEAYCSFEVSKLLKEKGFEGECIAYYSKYKDNNLSLYRWRNRQTYVNVRNNGYTLVPTQQMAMKWLREIFHIHIRLIHSIDELYRYEIYPMTGEYRSNCFEGNTYYSSYEEAVEAALKYVLENLI